MQTFPAEFRDLLNARGRALLAAKRPLPELRLRRGHTPIALLDGLIDPGTARDCIRILDEGMYPVLRRMHTPIPEDALTGMKRNYAERLPKTVRVKTSTFNSDRSKTLAAATEIGLAQMMWSDSFYDFAEALVGAPLRRERAGRQVICYEAGDYSGPHNDHHPERKETRNGFIDVHIMFSNDAVASQLLVYEEQGYLSTAHEVGRKTGIAVYRLPFWHYTTPLLPRPGRERDARRWLILGSFDYKPPLKELVYR